MMDTPRAGDQVDSGTVVVLAALCALLAGLELWGLTSDGPESNDPVVSIWALPVAALAATALAVAMPRRWSGKVSVVGRADNGLHHKESYLGFKWTSSQSLDYYRGDKSRKRGFEAEGYPESGGPVWSGNWSGFDRQGCPFTSGDRCKGTWNSNMPSAYRDDLAFDGTYKTFAIGTPNGRALKRNKAYFATYITNRGEADSGFEVEDGQATRRPTFSVRGITEQRTYCKEKRNRDSACYFANATTCVQRYPVGSSVRARKETVPPGDCRN